MANMLKIVAKNFFSKPATRLFPQNEREPFERSRGRIIFYEENCILCSICARKCPADAITVDRTSGKWELNAFRCIICGECVNSCPKKCIKMSNERRHSTNIKKIITLHKDVAKPAPNKAPATEKIETKPSSSTTSSPAAAAPSKTGTAANEAAATQS